MAEVLNRCIWPENNEGNEITQWVLKINLQVDPRRSLLRLQPDELSSDIEIEKQYAFDAQIKISHGNSFTVPVKDHTPNPQDLWDEEDLPIPIPEVDAVDEKGTPISPNWIADTLIDAKVFLPRGESDNLAKVIQCYLDVNWQVIGNHNEDLILNTCIYGVEFQDGIIKPYAASLIAQNILSQVDSEGYRSQLLEKNSEYSKDESAVEKGDQYMTTKWGNWVRRKTTIGWKFLVNWKDGFARVGVIETVEIIKPCSSSQVCYSSKYFRWAWLCLVGSIFPEEAW